LSPGGGKEQAKESAYQELISHQIPPIHYF
jgi:hypothetical protein